MSGWGYRSWEWVGTGQKAIFSRREEDAAAAAPKPEAPLEEQLAALDGKNDHFSQRERRRLLRLLGRDR